MFIILWFLPSFHGKTIVPFALKLFSSVLYMSETVLRNYAFETKWWPLKICLKVWLWALFCTFLQGNGSTDSDETIFFVVL